MEKTSKSQSSPIVIIDDDIATNQMLQLILTRGGFHARSAYCIEEGWQLIQDLRPDLILLDVNLPDGNGYDLCKKLQNEPGLGQIPILFISSNDDTDAKIRGFEVGGVDYIAKPFSGAEVIARASTHLRLKRAYDALAELQAERIKQLAGAQEMLMPQAGDIPEARFQAVLHQVLKAGGDFYDVIPVGNGVFDYVVADASGHDLSSSIWTAALKTLLTQYAHPAMSPLDILQSINNSLCRILPSGVFFTLVYARLNRQAGMLTLVNAGHPPAIIIPQNGGDPVVVWQDGDIIGAFKDVTFGTVDIQLNSHDRILLYSDGLVETGKNGHQETRESIIQLAQACARDRGLPLEQMIRNAITQMVGGNTVEDDVLLMGVQT